MTAETKVIVLEHHPNDSRIKIVDDGICQSLTGRMGTGGGNVPLILIINEGIIQQENDLSRNNRNAESRGACRKL